MSSYFLQTFFTFLLLIPCVINSMFTTKTQGEKDNSKKNVTDAIVSSITVNVVSKLSPALVAQFNTIFEQYPHGPNIEARVDAIRTRHIANVNTKKYTPQEEDYFNQEKVQKRIENIEKISDIIELNNLLNDFLEKLRTHWKHIKMLFFVDSNGIIRHFIHLDTPAGREQDAFAIRWAQIEHASYYSCPYYQQSYTVVEEIYKKQCSEDKEYFSAEKVEQRISKIKTEVNHYIIEYALNMFLEQLTQHYKKIDIIPTVAQKMTSYNLAPLSPAEKEYSAITQQGLAMEIPDFDTKANDMLQKTLKNIYEKGR